MENQRLTDLDKQLRGFPGKKILVLGDVMLDHYIWGETSRISPEAPVPVVGVQRESSRLGGAANVAANIKSLGGEPILVSVLGNDEGGRQLREAFTSRKISDSNLVVDSERPTVKKTRVIARSQQVVRIDREVTSKLSSSTLASMSAKIEAVADEIDGVLISDYGKGVICQTLLDRWLPFFREQKLPVCVDPKETHFHSYRQVTVLTPNVKEASFAAGQPIVDIASLEKAGQRLLTSLEAEALLITRGEEGMALLRKGTPTYFIPSFGREVYDVTGAGDTVVSTLMMALASGVSLEDGTLLANHAASRAIRELGTATVSCDEIRESLVDHHQGEPR